MDVFTIVQDPLYRCWTVTLTDERDGRVEIMLPEDGQRVSRRADRLILPEPGTAVKVYTRPECTACGRLAAYDAASTGGTWGFWCERCFPVHTRGKLGHGMGQRLIYVPTQVICHDLIDDADEPGGICPQCGGNLTKDLHEDGT